MADRLARILDRMEQAVTRRMDNYAQEQRHYPSRMCPGYTYLRPQDPYALRMYFREMIVPVTCYAVIAIVLPPVSDLLPHRYPGFTALGNPGVDHEWGHNGLTAQYVFMAKCGAVLLPLILLIGFRQYYFWNRRAARLRALEACAESPAIPAWRGFKISKHWTPQGGGSDK